MLNSQLTHADIANISESLHKLYNIAISQATRNRQFGTAHIHWEKRKQNDQRIAEVRDTWKVKAAAIMETILTIERIQNGN